MVVKTNDAKFKNGNTGNINDEVGPVESENTYSFPSMKLLLSSRHRLQCSNDETQECKNFVKSHLKVLAVNKN